MSMCPHGKENILSNYCLECCKECQFPVYKMVVENKLLREKLDVLNDAIKLAMDKLHKDQSIYCEDNCSAFAQDIGCKECIIVDLKEALSKIESLNGEDKV